MGQLTISYVAQQIGIQPSAIRYYEQIGPLPSAQRLSGQRRYDSSVLYRLAAIQRARQLGFSLTEIRNIAADCWLRESAQRDVEHVFDTS